MVPIIDTESSGFTELDLPPRAGWEAVPAVRYGAVFSTPSAPRVKGASQSRSPFDPA